MATGKSKKSVGDLLLLYSGGGDSSDDSDFRIDDESVDSEESSENDGGEKSEASGDENKTEKHTPVSTAAEISEAQANMSTTESKKLSVSKMEVDSPRVTKSRFHQHRTAKEKASVTIDAAVVQRLATIQRLPPKPKAPAEKSEASKEEGASDDTDEESNVAIETNFSHQSMAVCSVCLGGSNTSSDELVICDGCGVPVHEGCYGVSDVTSEGSEGSDDTTEPWFCDACRAGVTPECCLCPNSGGIYKETDHGRWVHLVCALYTQGCTFDDCDKLRPVALCSLPASRWGAKECSLCEDERLSRTGVVVTCDAGMCRTAFHVFCAHREGLVTEATAEEVKQQMADPFFVYCRVHADKEDSWRRKRNSLALQEFLKHNNPRASLTVAQQLRYRRKLLKRRREYATERRSFRPPGVAREKQPRLLSSSPSAVRRLSGKAELLGIDTAGVSNFSAGVGLAGAVGAGGEWGDVRRKWHVPPAMSPEFVQYFFERRERQIRLQQERTELQKRAKDLQRKHRQLRKELERLSREREGLDRDAMVAKCRHVYTILQDLSLKVIPQPAELKLFTSGAETDDVSELLNDTNAHDDTGSSHKSSTRHTGFASSSSTPAALYDVVHVCSICKKATAQHHLVQCDTCKRHQHIGCLVPPLERVPRKTKAYGWQCSDCSRPDSYIDSDVEVDTSEPMRLRETIKARDSFSPDREFLSSGHSAPHTPAALRKAYLQRHKLTGKTKQVPKLPNRTLLSSHKHPDSVSASDCKPSAAVESIRLDSASTEDNPDKLHDGFVKSKKRKFNSVLDPSRVQICTVCSQGKDADILLCCQKCQSSYHGYCVDPPEDAMNALQSNKRWFCNSCQPLS